MSSEIMPNVIPAASYKPRTVWIDNLHEDRHYDTLDWIDPDNDPNGLLSQSNPLVELSEAQIRDLHAKLGTFVARFDAEDALKGKRT